MSQEIKEQLLVAGAEKLVNGTALRQVVQGLYAKVSERFEDVESDMALVGTDIRDFAVAEANRAETNAKYHSDTNASNLDSTLRLHTYEEANRGRDEAKTFATSEAYRVKDLVEAFATLEANRALGEANTFTQAEITRIVGDLDPDALQTLQDIIETLEGKEDWLELLTEAIGQKAYKTDVEAMDARLVAEDARLNALIINKTADLEEELTAHVTYTSTNVSRLDTEDQRLGTLITTEIARSTNEDALLRTDMLAQNTAINARITTEVDAIDDRLDRIEAGYLDYSAILAQANSYANNVADQAREDAIAQAGVYTRNHAYSKAESDANTVEMIGLIQGQVDSEAIRIVFGGQTLASFEMLNATDVSAILDDLV